MRSIVKVAAAAFCLISGESGAKLKLSRFLVVVVDGGIGGTGGTAPLWRQHAELVNTLDSNH